MRTSRLTAATVALVALTAAACGTDEDTAAPTDMAAETSSPAETTAAAGDAATDESAVDIDDFRFRPETITVAAGTEVTWTNQDATAHTVTAGSPEEPQTDLFDLDVGEQGDTVSTSFDEPGTYPYFCELHPFMLGTVEVTG